MNIADFLAITTEDDKGNTVPRYTNAYAVIVTEDARRWPLITGGVPTIRIVADDAHIDDADKSSYLFEADLVGAHIDDNPAEYLPTALTVLAGEGLQLAAAGWAKSNGELAAGIKAAA